MAGGPCRAASRATGGSGSTARTRRTSGTRGKGQLTAREAASAPTTPTGKLWASIRGFFVGRPLASEDELGERLSKKKALAIFSSDAISSSAYATEEILRVLILGGAAALAFGLEISIAIAVLLIAVAVSYRQICIAYPGRRRVVFGLASEHRPNGLAGRGVGAPDRLRHDGRGLDLVRRRADHLRVPGAVRRTGR